MKYNRKGLAIVDVAVSSVGSVHQNLAITTYDFVDGAAAVVALVLSMAVVLLLTPSLIRKMTAGGMVGTDVNKADKPKVAELGGIAALFAFSVSISLVVGIQKLVGNIAEPPFLAAISVFLMAAMIGLIDDISDLKRWFKAVVLGIAALPLMLVHLGPEVITFPFSIAISFAASGYLLYWLVLVPIGVSGMANAMNMSAGYNGLESGQIAIVSAVLLVIGFLRGSSEFALMVFASLVGCSIGLFYYNRYPAKIFIGDIGTLGLGAAIGAGVILGHLEFFGLLAIGPAFYEGMATAYYGLRGENGHRRKACHSPTILSDGRLQPAAGAARYTLANLLLSKRPMTERGLVRSLLCIYAACGGVAILLSLV